MVDLRLDNVSKRYRIHNEDATHHAGLINKLRSRLGRGKEFWALRNISLEVSHGETLGIIGQNGSGKSTILKLLSRITAPTEGEILTRGRVAALLEVASGFHPELTGRENVFLSGSIIGMRRRAIHEKLDRIIDFAEIRPFIDLPVKRYSSGMFVRLGFSIAAHVEPDILLLDEVLAVGDTGFQNKCMRHILDLKRSGITIIFISHDLAAVERLCDRAALLHRGQLMGTGRPGDLVADYLASVEPVGEDQPEDGDKALRIRNVQFYDESGVPNLQFRTGYPLRVNLEFEAAVPIDAARFRLQFSGIDNRPACEFFSGPDACLPELPAGRGAIEFFCEEVALRPGVYHVGARVEGAEGSELAQRSRCALIHVGVGKSAPGAFYSPHTWRLASPVEPGPPQRSSRR